MCDPLSIGAIAVGLGGVAATNHGAKKAEKAAINVRRAEDSRQSMFKEQAEGGLKKNMDASTLESLEGKQASSVASREGADAAANMAAPRAAEQVAASSMGGNKVVQTNLADALAGVQARVGEIGNARARLNSFGDGMFETGIETSRGREQIGQAADFSRGSLRPVDAELEAASFKGANARALGTLLSTLSAGMSAGAGAAAGAGAGATSAATGATGIGAGVAKALGMKAAAPSAAGLFSRIAPWLRSAGPAIAAGMTAPDPYLRR